MGRVREDHARARELVLELGWNSTSYQILNPGFTLWFSDSRPAVAGYVCAARRWVVAGAPVCAPDHLAEVAAELERDAVREGARVVYFGAEDRLDTIYDRSRDHDAILLGAQPSWDPARWAERVSARKSLRAQFNRARNKGVSVSLWDSARAERDPRLRALLAEWLETRGLPPMHFLVEPETLESLADRRVFVAERDAQPVDFSSRHQFLPATGGSPSSSCAARAP